jgi:hypothetical protein
LGRRQPFGRAWEESGWLNLELSPLVIDRHADDVAGLGRRLLGRAEVEMVCRIASESVM